MSNEHHGERVESWGEQAGSVYSRRSMLGVLGIGAGASALGFGGVGGQVYAQQDETDEGDVRPIFGFPAESGDVTPPVEPDHEVTLNIDPREDRPIPEFYFDPVGLFIEPGDTVRFTLMAPHHTISAFHPDIGLVQRIPEAAPPISSPLLWEGAYFLYTFEEPGVYDLACLPHIWAGMVIRIVVGEATGPGAEPLPEPNPDATLENPEMLYSPQEIDRQVLSDPALDPENIMDKGSVAWTDLAPESKEFPEMPTEDDSAGDPLVAPLTGDQEVPPVETDARGCAAFKPTPDGRLMFHMLVTDIVCATQAHIHEAPVGENGPVVFPLVIYTENADGTGEGEPVSGTLEDPVVVTGTVDDEELVAALMENPTDYYVNVHTVCNPAGEVRGQITTGSPPEEETDDDGKSDDSGGSDDNGGGDDSSGSGDNGDDDGGY